MVATVTTDLKSVVAEQDSFLDVTVGGFRGLDTVTILVIGKGRWGAIKTDLFGGGHEIFIVPWHWDPGTYQIHAHSAATGMEAFTSFDIISPSAGRGVIVSASISPATQLLKNQPFSCSVVARNTGSGTSRFYAKVSYIVGGRVLATKQSTAKDIPVGNQATFLHSGFLAAAENGTLKVQLFRVLPNSEVFMDDSRSVPVAIGGIPTDTVQPSVNITSPTHGAQVPTSALTVGGTATDNVGVTNVRASLDGVSSVQVTGLNVWSVTFSNVPDGPHTVEVSAYDAANNKGSSAVAVNVATGGGNGGGGGEIPPEWIYYGAAGVGIAALAAWAMGWFGRPKGRQLLAVR